MKQHRPTLIYLALAVLASVPWIVPAITFPFGGWWIAAGTVTTFVVADRGEQAISRRLDRPKRVRRRIHARPRPRPVTTERTNA